MQIFDNFVKDPFLLKGMQDLSNEFWTKGYYWWQNGSPSVTLRHRLIDYIWLQGRTKGLPRYFQGFEHWIGIYDASGQTSTMAIDDQTNNREVKGKKVFSLTHHFDKDEFLYKSTGLIVSPAIGCVYYPPVAEQCEGGELRIYDGDNLDDSFELVEPVPNRLIIFNPGKLHAVQEVTGGIRYAIAINVWEQVLSSGQMSEMNEAF